MSSEDGSNNLYDSHIEVFEEEIIGEEEAPTGNLPILIPHENRHVMVLSVKIECVSILYW
jgi:hypothetical protein